MSIVSKENQKEVIKFLKSPEYQKLMNKYKNRFEAAKEKFEAQYMWDDYDCGGLPIYSEIYIHSLKAKMLQEKLDDIVEISPWAELMRELLLVQIEGAKSHFYGVTNGFWMSKDVAVFTEDDKFKCKMVHENNIHLFIIGLMNPQGEWMELTESQKLEIFDGYEKELLDEEIVV